jgi:hypothetical protein
MEPITTTAIISGLTAIAASGIDEVGKKAIGDAYEALKAAIKKKFGSDGKLPQAIDRLESDWNSQALKLLVKEKVEEAKAEEDGEIRDLARKLLNRLRVTPKGGWHIQQAVGSFNAQADRNSTATININTK